MKKDLKNKRRDFLMNVCPTVAMAFLGITVLESCSSITMMILILEEEVEIMEVEIIILTLGTLKMVIL